MFYWLIIGIVAVATLFGIKDLLFFVLGAWDENGGKFAFFLFLAIILLIAPGIVKIFYPEYFGITVWIFILYIIGLIVYRNLVKYRDKNEGQ